MSRDLSLFQSTLPVWGETSCPSKSQYFLRISIHSPRVGRDLADGDIMSDCSLFQSTLPVWGETHGVTSFVSHFGNFNPLSPCGERPTYCFLLLAWKKFQSTLPVWGETKRLWATNYSIEYFNPLSPCGERLRNLFLGYGLQRISIHSPRVGRDCVIME